MYTAMTQSAMLRPLMLNLTAKVEHHHRLSNSTEQHLLSQASYAQLSSRKLVTLEDHELAGINTAAGIGARYVSTAACRSAVAIADCLMFGGLPAACCSGWLPAVKGLRSDGALCFVWNGHLTLLGAFLRVCQLLRFAQCILNAPRYLPHHPHFHDDRPRTEVSVKASSVRLAVFI